MCPIGSLKKKVVIEKAEIQGPLANPKIVNDYFSATNLKPRDDVTAWCAAFANWSLQQAGFQGTGKATVASFLGWGEEIDEPVRGCIVVFKRLGGNHVGFYLGETESSILLLGGNQENNDGMFEVSEKEYSKADLLGYRLPSEKDRLPQVKKLRSRRSLRPRDFSPICNLYSSISQTPSGPPLATNPPALPA